MPLNESLPVIDDRLYAEILEELRTRIPRYTPEWKGWTDLNDSDIGMTFAQVVAWLTEMMIHRMGKVPQLNYVKFLELLGVELRSSQPAMVEIEFPVKADHTQRVVMVPIRTQVSAEAHDGGASIVFETERTLGALAVRLTSVLAFDGVTYSDKTADNQGAGPYHPFGVTGRVGSALYVGFQYDKDYKGVNDQSRSQFPKVDLDLAVWVNSKSRLDGRNMECGNRALRAHASADVVWEAWDGSDWQELDVVKDDTLAFTRTGHVIVQTPVPGVMKPGKLGDPGQGQENFYLRARLTRSAYEQPPEFFTIRHNTVLATQAETAKDEVLGGSNGRRDQMFVLSGRPVLPDSVKLEVDEGDGFVQWRRVDDFFSSRERDTHYVLNATTGEVRLGGLRIDGALHGHVPVANVHSPGTNIVAREYRFGGGTRGNISAGMAKTLVTPVDGIDDGQVMNRFEAAGGRDEEGLDEARVRASRSLRSRDRAVTAEDFEQLAQEAANVKRAKALPLYHPNFPGTQIPGVVSVIIVPDSEADRPTPSDGTMRAVCAYLDKRRLLTTEVFVLRPTYQQVEVSGEILVDDDADLREVRQKVEEELTAYFHPLRGGDEGRGWAFGGTIFYSKVVNRIFQVPGVSRIQELSIALDGERADKCEDIELKDYALLYSSEHHVAVRYVFNEDGR